MMPRYSREKLLGVSCQRLFVEPASLLCAILFIRMRNRCRSWIAYAPLMSDDLLEAVEHAIVRVRTDSLASLQLSVEPVSIANLSDRSGALHSGLDDVQRVPG